MIQENFDIYGYTKIMKNGVVVWEGRNAINAGLKEYLANSLSDKDESNKGLYGAELFGASDRGKKANNEDFEGVVKSGIVVSDIIGAAAAFGAGKGSHYAMQTTQISADAENTFGAKWRGTITVGDEEFDAPITLVSAIIGYDIDNNESTDFPYFNTAFATQQFAGTTLADNDTFTIEWEIFIQ